MLYPLYGKIICRMNSPIETGAITPPRLFPSLKAGFDAVASHISLILFPIALDGLLWFGYHLRIKTWLIPIMESYLELSSSAASTELKELLNASRATWTAIAENYNLVIFLRSYPLGIPSLISGLQPAETPLGPAPIIDFTSSLTSIGLMLVFTLVGILLGAQYFFRVARVTNRETEPVSGRTMLSILWQVLLFNLTFYAVMCLVCLPVLMITTIIALISPSLGQIVLMFLVFILAWLSLPLIFSMHGIFTYRQPFRVSLANSIRLGRYAGPQIATFTIVVLILATGLNILWSIPAADDWLLVIGIAGHAYVSTALLAGSFIYYRSAMRWVQEIIQHRLNAQKPPA
ncbi:MAG: hypothetical protein JW704_02355 [Anaerolineaceae bacterium]|nr:hypothetical protein [Anaerolineaceae bacterium]MBN2676820.1 hypothetical protein [Anaerolineaceae bacterium]